MHIKQKNTDPYTVVVCTTDVLTHPAVINRPDLFEIVFDEPPENHQKLLYQEGVGTDE